MPGGGGGAQTHDACQAAFWLRTARCSMVNWCFTSDSWATHRRRCGLLEVGCHLTWGSPWALEHRRALVLQGSVASSCLLPVTSWCVSMGQPVPQLQGFGRGGAGSCAPFCPFWRKRVKGPWKGVQCAQCAYAQRQGLPQHSPFAASAPPPPPSPGGGLSAAHMC